MTLRGYFITGTDTEVGKTTVCAGLARAWHRASALRIAALKPVAAGLDEHGRNDDVQRLVAAGSAGLTAAEVGPLQLREPCAPHIAAELEGRRIEPGPLLAALRAAAAKADAVLVEGVGGFRVPLAPGWDSADLARDLGLPVMLVVGLRLGCINHALLTAEAVRARGLVLAGWVATDLTPTIPHRAGNLAALQAGLAAPCLGTVPYLEHPAADAVADHIRSEGLTA